MTQLQMFDFQHFYDVRSWTVTIEDIGTCQLSIWAPAELDRIGVMDFVNQRTPYYSRCIDAKPEDDR